MPVKGKFLPWDQGNILLYNSKIYRHGDTLCLQGQKNVTTYFGKDPIPKGK